MTKKIYLLICAFVILSVTAYGQPCPLLNRLYVDSSVTISLGGATWLTAFKTLGEALTVANNCNNVDEIWVAKGTYYPTADHNRDSAFRIFRNGIKLYGGFSGMETLLSDRNVNAYPAILSGDIGILGDSTDNSYHVITIVPAPSFQIDTLTRVDGFTITGGNADLQYVAETINAQRISSKSGGGIYNYRCSPLMANCTFSGNQAYGLGGAIFNDAYYGGVSNPVIINCFFRHNKAYSGGAIYNDARFQGISSPSILNCTFSFNAALVDYLIDIFESGGGAIFNDGGDRGVSNPVITDCFFSNCISQYGGAICSRSWDPFWGGSSNPVILRCTFLNNHATIEGGAISFDDHDRGTIAGHNRMRFLVKDCSFYNNTCKGDAGAISFWSNGVERAGNSYITNCVFANNKAFRSGVLLFGAATDSLIIINSTFFNNSVDHRAGVIFSSTQSLTEALNIRNCIFWGNSAPSWDGSTQQDPEFYYHQGGAPVFKYNLTQSYGTNGVDGNMVGVYPQFADTTNLPGTDGIYGTLDDGLRLKPGSPAINKGNNYLLVAGDTTDITGASRIQQDIVDMGAYEFAPFPCPSSPIVYVDSSISASGDGSTWLTAYKSLNEALEAANYCTGVNQIWVAKGTYYPTTDGNRDSSFRILRNGIKVYGGFEGSETALSKRIVSANQTILSGDIGIPNVSTDNCYHVMTIVATPSSNIDTTTRVDGFIIKDGYSRDQLGGVISITINGQSLERPNGAGIFNYGGGSGNECSPSIVGCAFINNSALSSGGGIYNRGISGISSPFILNCRFNSNSTYNNGAAISNDGAYGGVSNPSINNSIFFANNAPQGGAIYDNVGSKPSIINCTFYANSSLSGGVISENPFYGSANLKITNSIFFRNTPNDISNAGTLSITYSITQGAGSGESTNMINEDPLFLNESDPAGTDGIFATSDDGLRLKAGSPALNTGNNDTVNNHNITTDILDSARIQGGRVDMGAYEGAVSCAIWYKDADKDGYGSRFCSIQACTKPAGYVSNCKDCNDDDKYTYPGAPERCDNKDNNCDGKVDEGLTKKTWYRDEDCDGYGNKSCPKQSCSKPAGYVSNCNDCNDRDGAIYPGAKEICDGKDNDCDGKTDEGLTTKKYYKDEDGDGYGNPDKSITTCEKCPKGYVTNNKDCNDKDKTINPAAKEICDGKDNDCDGKTDEGFTTKKYYKDADKDGYGDPKECKISCSCPAGYVTNCGDCNDKDKAINPKAKEVCDGKDNDCDGKIDEGFTTKKYYKDADKDGYGDLKECITTCGACPAGYVTNCGDCNDKDKTINPGAKEICDGKDNDCDGKIDEGFTTKKYYKDADKDGYGDPKECITTCGACPSGYVTNDNDCDDKKKSVNPGAVEIPGNGIDDNCNGKTDDVTYLARGSNTQATDNYKEEGINTNLVSVKEALKVKVLPNPSPNYFTLNIKGGSDKPVQLRVTDISGRVIELKNKIATNSTLTIGHRYRPGVYFAEVMQENERVVIKCIKQ